MNKDDLAKYQYFIKIITDKISNFFEEQKEYLVCKQGCSLCCEDGEYPFSEIEFEYLKIKYQSLSNEVKILINNKIISLVKKYREYKKENNTEQFLYECPFLLNGSCTVYENRGIICRTFGLISENSNGSLTLPFCYEKGLNYSKVYDSDTKTISEKKIKELKYKVLPKAYNLSLNNIEDIAKELNINFGECKSLVQWLNYFVPYND